MHHVAIMNPKTCPVADIVSGKKTIESRWYKVKAKPWDAITSGDIIYFKESGKPVSARATVIGVVQFEKPTPEFIQDVIEKYGEKISPVHMQEFIVQTKDKKYCILMFLTNPQSVKSFEINKTGFGSAAAWLTVKNINSIKIKIAR